MKQKQSQKRPSVNSAAGCYNARFDIVGLSKYLVRGVRFTQLGVANNTNSLLFVGYEPKLSEALPLGAKYLGRSQNDPKIIQNIFKQDPKTINK